MNIPESFKTDVRCVMLLYRNKDGQTGNAQRKAFKVVTQDEVEWDAVVTAYKDMQKQSEYALYRIYSSVNRRNITKAIREFRRRQLEAEFGTPENHEDFYYDIHNRFFSCVASPSCSLDNYFIIDCDTPEQLKDAEKLDKDLIIHQYPTKNGFHIVTKPFNPSLYPKLEIKKDAMMYVG